MLRNFAVPVIVTLHWLALCRHGGGNIAIADASIIPIGDPNIAVGKISSQSSTYEEKGDSRKAIDGSLANSYDNGDCTLTKQDFEPWWMLDLKSAFQVSAVVITNRGDCCESRIRGAEILIGDLPDNGGTMNPRCATVHSMSLGETMTFNCAGMQGQYVTITIPGRKESLSLCEVQVLAHPWLHIVHGGGRSPVRDSETNVGLQGRTLNFPNESKSSFAVLSPLQPLNLMEFTLCLRVVVEHLDEGKIIIFSYHSQDDELRILRERAGQFGLHMGGQSVTFALPDLSTLGSHLCVTWESEFGLTAFWMNGKRSVRKVHNVGHILQPGGTVMLGQNQGAEDMPEQQKWRFVGEITDLYMWDYVLKSHDIQAVFQSHQFPSGNIFDWKILSYKIIGNVMVLPKDNDYGGVPNVAITGEALQSSTYNQLAGPGNAIDGLTSGEFTQGSCTHTDYESNPWWIVDLKAQYRVFRVSISNRKDCCGNRLNGAEIRIGNSAENGGITNPRCAIIISLDPGETRSFYCEDSQGQFVTVNQPNGGILTLCEVQVFGLKVDSTSAEPDQSKLPWEPEGEEQVPMSVSNVALKGKAFQSSTYNIFGVPEHAIDGSTSANYLRGHCTHTELDINPWWTLDLMAEFHVWRVNITNRGDCCAERINGAEILIGNSPEKGGIKNPRCATISSLGPGETGTFDCGGIQGQYVTVTIPGIRYLSMCQVQVFGVRANSSGLWDIANRTETSAIEQWIKPLKPYRLPWEDTKGEEAYSSVYNAAHNGKAFQSSTYNKLGAAENANDGSKSSNYLRGHCTHTQLEVNPWWMVDLRTRFRVLSVVVTNRGDCCGDRIEGAEIRIGDSEVDGGIRNPRCAIITSLSSGETRKFECEGMLGQYVTITIPGGERYLSLCEVEVYGLREMPPVPNVAFLGQASQSSTFNQLGAAGNAIDGSTAVDFMRGSCTHTDYEQNPWWRVDLGAEFSVSSVSITNREDCCAYRLDGAEIRIGNSMEKGGSTNPRCAIISSIPDGQTHNFGCQGMKGQYVTVFIPGYQVLTLCEVQVFGVKVQSSGDSEIPAEKTEA
ncbi:uncharacterized protein LOC128327440 [Hemicordylus capensis]|uniref:uncharacterized protein LOC128327440 n=1 Tax=Hemicordylus capensis TaxID=884348 RepID=UPI002302A8BA|nr:uncharacterized protein LOC128327440 [Hemicordylus capensis]